MRHDLSDSAKLADAAKAGKALGNEVRLRILHLLAGGSLTHGQIMARLKKEGRSVDRGALSKHLTSLRKGKLIKSHTEEDSNRRLWVVSDDQIIFDARPSRKPP